MRSWKLMIPLFLLGVFVLSCEQDNLVTDDAISPEVIDKISKMGFNPDGIERVEEGYRIERDIIITHENLAVAPTEHRVPNAEQYHTFNLVSAGGGRTISVYMSVEGSGGGGGNGKGKGKKGGGGSGDFSSTYGAALDEAISRFNSEPLDLSFSRTDNSNADIVFTRLSKGDERRGVLGSAGFPTGSGDPYGEIKMSGILESRYGLSENGIATIIAHEMGHCIGFRHTDWFNRSISCGSGGSEGQETTGVGAVHIDGTPTGAKLSDKSWMLSCTDGSDRPFNNDDKKALNHLY